MLNFRYVKYTVMVLMAGGFGCLAIVGLFNWLAGNSRAGSILLDIVVMLMFSLAGVRTLVSWIKKDLTDEAALGTTQQK